MPSKALKIVLILLLILVVVSPLLYYWFAKSELLYVTSEQNLKIGELVWAFAKEGWLFRPLILPPHELIDQEQLQQLIKKGMRRTTQLVVCSPLVSYALNGVSLSFPNGVSFGDYPNFEYRLVKQQPDLGWQMAAEGALGLANQTPLPTLLLYTSSNREAERSALLFSDHFRGPLLDTIPLKEGGRKRMEELAETIEERGTLLVVIPYVDDFNLLLTAKPLEGVRWIVDERYGAMVGKGALEGVVYTNLFETLQPILKGEKGIYPIVRGYRTSKTKL